MKFDLIKKIYSISVTMGAESPQAKCGCLKKYIKEKLVL
jgi:hypothetical protein